MYYIKYTQDQELHAGLCSALTVDPLTVISSFAALLMIVSHQ